MTIPHQSDTERYKQQDDVALRLYRLKYDQINTFSQEFVDDVVALLKAATQRGYNAGLDAAVQCLPKKIDDGEGWDIAFENCCPGDDTAHGFNHAIDEVTAAIRERRAA